MKLNKGTTLKKLFQKEERELRALIKVGCNGGNGEFDKFLPEELVEKSIQFGHSYMPVIKNDKIIWEQIF